MSLPAISAHARMMIVMIASVSCWLIKCPGWICQTSTVSLTWVFFLLLNLNSHKGPYSFNKMQSNILKVAFENVLVSLSFSLKKSSYSVFWRLFKGKKTLPRSDFVKQNPLTVSDILVWFHTSKRCSLFVQ